MTIKLNPKQERVVRDAIESGSFRSVEEFIDNAITALSRRQISSAANRKDAVRRMEEFSDQHRLGLGEPVTRKLVREGHRY